MKKVLLILSVFCASAAYAAPVTFPVDFETVPVTGDFVNFDAGIGTVISNPQSGGINTSSKVGQIVRNGPSIYSGSKLILSGSSPTGGVSMKVFTTKPIGTIVKLKLEGGTGGNFEMNAVTKTSGAWETLTWNFSTAAATKTDFVFMFDFGQVGDGTASSTFLFDDLIEVPATPYAPINLDFESATVTSDFINFGGISSVGDAVSTVETNPQSGGINTSGKVGKMVRNGGEVYAGSKIILSNTLDFSTNSYIIMKVYTDAPIGTTMKFKLEGFGAYEVDAVTTVSGAWETLKWNFAGQPAQFNELVFLFDFGNVGNGSAASTFLFDDVAQSADGITAAGPPTTDLFVSGSLTNYTISPNPTEDNWLIDNQHSVINSVVVLDVLGNEIMALTPNEHSVNIDASRFESGIYVAKVSFNGATNLIRLIKE